MWIKTEPDLFKVYFERDFGPDSYYRLSILHDDFRRRHCTSTRHRKCLSKNLPVEQVYHPSRRVLRKIANILSNVDMWKTNDCYQQGYHKPK